MHALTDFLPDTLPADPLPLAAQWLQSAYAAKSQPNPNAMVLATVDGQGRPSARVVLCKDLVVDAGYLSFFTNYESRKGQDLAADGRAAVVMHWDALHRQVRFEGQVRLAPAVESDEYFASRPWQRRVGAWTSQQSRPLARRADLLRALEETAQRLQVPVPGPEDDVALATPIPRPPFWGGYHLWIEAVELWAEGSSRLHDRARWQREVRFSAADGPGRTISAPPERGAWQATRLQP